MPFFRTVLISSREIRAAECLLAAHATSVSPVWIYLVCAGKESLAEGRLACKRLLFEQLARKRYAFLGRISRLSRSMPFRMRLRRTQHTLLPPASTPDFHPAGNNDW